MDPKTQPEWLKLNADGSATITLRSGTSVAGAPVKSLTMREPLIEDQLASAGPGSAAEREIGYFANLCMVDPAAIRALTVRDYRRVERAYGLFTED